MSRRALFEPALGEMTPGRWGCRAFPSFRQYSAEHGLPETDTATAISVDTREKLAPELRAAQIMVLRLGRAGSGTGTRFA